MLPFRGETLLWSPVLPTTVFFTGIEILSPNIFRITGFVLKFLTGSLPLGINEQPSRKVKMNTAVSRKVVQQKRTRQCRKVLRVMGFLVVDWGFRFFSNIEGNSTNKCICAFSFLVGRHPWTSINQRQTRSTHNTNRHCHVRFYTFVGQPLSKQLYIIKYKAYHWSKAGSKTLGSHTMLQKCLKTQLYLYG